VAAPTTTSTTSVGLVEVQLVGDVWNALSEAEGQVEVQLAIQLVEWSSVNLLNG
jgi:hypothetical protein